MRIRFLFTTIIIFACLMLSCKPEGHYIAVTGYAQGGVYSVKFNTSGVDVPPERIKSDVDSILLKIDNSVSGYNKGSLLSRFNAGEAILPDEIFEKMYAYASLFYSTYDGLVDAAAAQLFDIWGFGFTGGELPDSASVREALLGCGMKRLKPLMTFDGIVRADGLLYPQDLLLEGENPEHMPQLNFNAFAQGYTADLIASYLHSMGVEDMLVDIGEIFCQGHNPSGNSWKIGVDAPIDGNNTPGANLQALHKCPSEPHGLVTSGNYRKFYIVNGQKFSHTIDPRSGYPVNHNLLSATVQADKAVVADAAATCCMVMGLEKSKDFILRSGYEGCLLYDDKGVIRCWTSPGFDISYPTNDIK